eukprot:gnl/MRDRNA2_/MRDRNA2_34639_c0_seq1.p1 gnl/MRDRNA2_/MRDRNA2_34639_c0~~gnl/MRDRNA2_/MRDRNA2_34639_c0_seq1.p1  ORF type:complete len:768 (-),score=145.33 gnl/MRDRNA2_/MRDRNA2_34639_c0_seq1:19-2322(-)
MNVKIACSLFIIQWFLCSSKCDFAQVDLIKVSKNDLEKESLGLHWDKPMLLRNINLLPGFVQSKVGKQPVSREDFVEMFGHLQVPVTHDYAFQSVYGNPPSPVYMTFKDWEGHLGSTRSIANYIFYRCSLDPKCVQLVLENYGIPWHLQRYSANIFISAGLKAEGLPFHKHRMTWLLNLAGRKTWFVAPPDKPLPLKSFRDYPKATLEEATEVQSCTQDVFEIVYVPDYWWHSTYIEANWSVGVGAQSPAKPWQYQAAVGNATYIETWRGKEAERLQALHAAARGGHVQIVELILRDFLAKGMAKDLWGETQHILKDHGDSFVMEAANAGHVSVLEVLLRLKANVRISGSLQPMHLAAREGHMAVLEFLVRLGRSVVERDRVQKFEPIHHAAGRGHVDVVKFLSEHRASCGTAVTGGGFQPMHFAAEAGRELVVNVLVQMSAAVGARQQQQAQPMHLAAEEGHALVVALLAKHGANVTATDDLGVQPLFLASRHNHKDVIDMLIRLESAAINQPGVVVVKALFKNFHPTKKAYIFWQNPRSAVKKQEVPKGVLWPSQELVMRASPGHSWILRDGWDESSNVLEHVVITQQPEQSYGVYESAQLAQGRRVNLDKDALESAEFQADETQSAHVARAFDLKQGHGMNLDDVITRGSMDTGARGSKEFHHAETANVAATASEISTGRTNGDDALDEDDKAFDEKLNALKKAKKTSANFADLTNGDEILDLEIKRLIQEETQRLQAKKKEAVESEKYLEAKRIKQRLERIEL